MDVRNMEPLYIKINPKDNVAVIVNKGGLKKDTLLDGGFKLLSDIPEANKVMLEDVSKDEPIIRYGEIIGYAKSDLKKGSWLHEDKVRLPRACPLDNLKSGYMVEHYNPLEGYTFLGYRNDDGSVGTKNILGITTTVQCSEGVVNVAVDRIRSELLPKYKNVDDVVALNHLYGCGVAIYGDNAEIPIRAIRNLSKNPNFGGQLLTICLGCEKLVPTILFPKIENDDLVVLQECHGFKEMIDEIMRKAEKKLEKLNSRTRVECPVSDLVVGLQCGGSDAFSGITSNPAVGFAADLLVRAGAKVMFSEVTEIRDAVHLLAPRTKDDKVLKKLVREMKWYDKYLEKSHVDRDANPSPGNKKGGLSNVVDKALGSVAKSGTTSIVDVLSPGERIKKRGMTYAATPASDFFCGTMQLASGMTLQVFTTGRGTTYNLKISPVIKVSSNSTLKEKWFDLIDLDAGRIATGKKSIEEVGWELFKLIIDVASGRKKTYGDIHGLYNALGIFNPAPIT
ncbi:galactarate dehydratase [Clostridium sp. MT-14]|uniref:Galactarate dehydratase n=1 Tax=Clostridium aromativorans TaxID=2836848 RepID=A0ABS8N5D6_9CLOT|nr:galactarate dehydratase [Clostridium aromativorans]MCC9295028.1 galactarate dehydratase [Clostridium aromativorans]